MHTDNDASAAYHSNCCSVSVHYIYGTEIVLCLIQFVMLLGTELHMKTYMLMLDGRQPMQWVSLLSNVTLTCTTWMNAEVPL